jgi:hypothetical protein
MVDLLELLIFQKVQSKFGVWCETKKWTQANKITNRLFVYVYLKFLIFKVEIVTRLVEIKVHDV